MATRTLLVPAVALAGAALALAAAGAAVASYRASRHPDRTWDDPEAHLALGPKGSALEQAIEDRLNRALAALDAPGGRGGGLAAYQEHLAAARGMLRRAILADLEDSRAIQRLAAVTWELDALDGRTDEQGIASLAAIAGERAARVPLVQIELGELLYKMGRADEARAFMARAVRLSSSSTGRVVASMRTAGEDASEILRALPEIPAVLRALAPVFASEGRGAELIGAFDERLGSDPAALIPPFADLALRNGSPERVTERLTRLGALADPQAEAERQLALGRAASAAGDPGTAYRSGQNALRLWPADPRFCEFAATAALESGKPGEAEATLRDGLARLAAVDGTEAWRGRLYRYLGETYDRMGRGDEAVVAYRRALEQDPQETVARERLAQIESLIGAPQARQP